MALIFYMSSMPEPPLPGGISDKVAHTLGYAALGWLAARAVGGGLGAPMRMRDALVAIAIGVAYGISDEYHQSFVPGRDSDIHDVYADAVGAAIGACAWWAIIALHKPQTPKAKSKR
jgi:VanZ family protein